MVKAKRLQSVIGRLQQPSFTSVKVRAVEDRKARGVAWTIVPVLLALRFGTFWCFPVTKTTARFSKHL
ncbi:hypothetical protein P5673_009524 [Acropora cervicornis]|uniref:Uncharacterized protein n=1 Tax=Acropora cervicornis TaxID=6130 RepID=A0AAD9VA18_ACRCE|nr:hypothetical protein P5673_009524 [Acropora cervicornis]